MSRINYATIFYETPDKTKKEAFTEEDELSDRIKKAYGLQPKFYS